MKILLVHICFSETFQSGINPIVFKTYEKLNNEGHEVFIFATDMEPYCVKDYKYSKYFIKSTPFVNQDKNKFVHIKLLLKSMFNKEAQSKLAKMLDDIKPDLVHIHTTLDISFSILKPIKKRNIPIIYTFHDMGLLCPASLYSNKISNCNLCKKYNTLPCFTKKCVNGSFLKSLIISFKSIIERFSGALKDIDLYLTVSNASKEYAVSMGIDKNKIEVLPNFINKDLMNNAVPNYSKDTKYFLYAGGTNQIKGIYTLLETIKQIPRDIEFHIAGGGDYTTVKDFAKKYNLDNIKFLGHLTREQIQEEYKNCISVIMPSEWFETFGMINIEAAIYGKPSISSNIGGLPEVVDNTKTGLIFEPANIEQLKECILKYWNDRNLVIEHGKNARKKVLSKYNEDLYYNKLYNLYKEVLNGR